MTNEEERLGLVADYDQLMAERQHLIDEGADPAELLRLEFPFLAPCSSCGHYAYRHHPADGERDYCERCDCKAYRLDESA